MEGKINKEDMKVRFNLVSTYIEYVMKQNGIPQSYIVEKTGLKQQAVSRFFSGKYAPRLTTFLQIIYALDMKIRLEDTTGKLPRMTL
jgi:DNA-binding phage protein